MDDYNKKYQEWLNNPNFDEETKEELKSIEGNEEEIKDRFYKDLEFGTAGLKRSYRSWNKQNEQIYCW